MNITHTFTLNAGRPITVRAFTLDEYKELMVAKSENKIVPRVRAIMAACGVPADLSKHEAEKALVQLWAESLGESDHTATWVCECGKEIPVPIKFNQIQTNADPEDQLFYQLGHLRLKLRYPKIFDDADTVKMIVSCIEYVIAGDEQIALDDMTGIELDELYSYITSDDISAIKNILLKPEPHFAVPIKCECGVDGIHVIKGMKEFFKLI